MNLKMIRISKIFAFVIISVFLLSSCKDKPTEDLQGAVITALKGTVTITKPKNSPKAISTSVLYTKEALLMPGYIIETGADSTADLQFPSGVQLRIGPSSKAKLGAARIMTGKDFSQVQMNLEKGKLFTRVNKMKKGSRFNIVTPTSIAGVRGTDFMVKEENGKTTTMVKNGSVEVADSDVKKTEVVTTDNKAIVDKNGDIKVEPQTEDDKKELNDMGSEMASITENGRNQIKSIIQTFEEQKALIKQTIEEQKRSNEQVIGDQKNRDQDLLKNQIKRDQELIKKVRGDADRIRDEVKRKSKEETDKIKSGGKKDIDKIKKSPIKGLDKTKSELDKLKKLQK